MILLLLALAVSLVGGFLALLFGRLPKAATALGVGSSIASSVVGLAPALGVLFLGPLAAIRWPWHVPYGEFYVTMDPLSATFLVLIFGLAILAAIYGGAYLYPYHKTKSLGPPWFFFNLLVSSMALLVVARNGILFLTAWEVMAIASFFLVTFENEKAQVRNAGWTYLVAAHAGTAFLLVYFALWGKEAGSLNFDQFAGVQGLAPATASAIFLLALAGFGAKAGFVPIHVWLPEAHPAAPSHVSALMSGVMIKMGIYGILRTLTFLGQPPEWWGITLILIGLTSGIFGVLFALAQHDLKRLLAYHSVENIGIIALGMGVGVWGLSQGNAAVAFLGFAGAILHVTNHAIFKSLLFLGAGSVLHATGELEMDKLGGLLKKMPITGGTFLITAAAISGLPPSNGFISEFLILSASLKGAIAPFTGGTVALLALVAGLALIGGLAVACFTKAFGVTFLGSARTRETEHAHEPGKALLIPMLALAAFCLFIGVASTLAVRLVVPAAAQLSGVSHDFAMSEVTAFSAPLAKVTIVVLVFLGMAAALVLLRRWLLAGREVARAVTWDCGYEKPSPRMQYTSSSFAQPLVEVFSQALRTRRWLRSPDGYFPEAASYQSETPDVFTERVYRPALVLVEWSSAKLHGFQQGRVHLYLLYIFVTLVILLVWRLGF